MVHEFLEAYIKSGGIFRSTQWKWYFKYRRWINVDSTESMALTEYHFYDAEGEEIELSGAKA